MPYCNNSQHMLLDRYCRIEIRQWTGCKVKVNISYQMDTPSRKELWTSLSNLNEWKKKKRFSTSRGVFPAVLFLFPYQFNSSGHVDLSMWWRIREEFLALDSNNKNNRFLLLSMIAPMTFVFVWCFLFLSSERFLMTTNSPKSTTAFYQGRMFILRRWKWDWFKSAHTPMPLSPTSHPISVCFIGY